MTTSDMYTRYFYYQEVMADCGAPEIIQLKDKWIKSAKIQHKCSGCDNPIEAGQPYLYTVYLVDGELRHEKRHSAYTCD